MTSVSVEQSIDQFRDRFITGEVTRRIHLMIVLNAFRRLRFVA